MFKNIIFSSLASLSIATPAFAQYYSAPNAAYRSVDTGYGQFGCQIRAENKFYQMGASSVQKTTNSVFAILGQARLVVWCRGPEAVIFVAGPDPVPLRDEIYKAF